MRVSRARPHLSFIEGFRKNETLNATLEEVFLRNSFLGGWGLDCHCCFAEEGCGKGTTRTVGTVDGRILPKITEFPQIYRAQGCCKI